LMPRLGLGIACGVLAAWAIFVFVSRPSRIGKSPGGRQNASAREASARDA